MEWNSKWNFERNHFDKKGKEVCDMWPRMNQKFPWIYLFFISKTKGLKLLCFSTGKWGFAWDLDLEVNKFETVFSICDLS